MNKKRIAYIFLLVGLLGLIGSVWGIPCINQISGSNINNPSYAELSNSTIIYTHEVDRVIEPFEVSVNLSSTYPDATKVEMTIYYSNATDINYTLTEVSNIWSYSLYFEPNAPLGQQSFQLFVYEGVILSDQSYIQFFEIKNSAPKIGISLSHSEIYRNETLFFNVTPMDAEDSFSTLTWSWQILYQSLVINSSAGNKQISDLSHFFPSTLANNRLGEYSLKGTISDSDGAITTNTVNFTVLNNAPIITAYNITFLNNESQILRDTEHFNLKVNVSDVEVAPNNIFLKIHLYGPSDTFIDRSGRMTRSSPWNFDGNISLPLSVPTGQYTGEIIAYETINDIEYNTSTSFTFSLLNNIPNASAISFTLNDRIPTGSGLRFKEFEKITFKINVTDVDPEGIEIIQILLIPIPGEEELFFSFRNPENDVLEFTIYAKDLPYGQWVTWIYVIDSDGERIQSAVSYSFDIIQDRFPKILPWIMLLVGAVVAFGIAMAFLGTRYISLRRDFDNLLSRSGEYKKSESVPKKVEPETPSPKKEQSKTADKSSVTIKKSPTKKHKLFREIKKK
ncbi:MAG: hypothetical protein JW776_06495 [Candidatus Lokiarchaeota archaeon]|nr:hypothetical protein [Candidatus Lokiarchaeota archaeon]